MKICGTVLVILYAGLMLFAICKERSKTVSSAFIAVGCLADLVYMLLSVIWNQNLIAILIAGMTGISTGTLINGFKQDRIHIPHHIIRLVIEIIIITVCWMGR